MTDGIEPARRIGRRCLRENIVRGYERGAAVE
jgi:hypothetical protein